MSKAERTLAELSRSRADLISDRTTQAPLGWEASGIFPIFWGCENLFREVKLSGTEPGHDARRVAASVITAARSQQFSESPVHASPRQTNRHTLQETSRIAYLDDLIVVIQIADVGKSV